MAPAAPAALPPFRSAAREGVQQRDEDVSPEAAAAMSEENAAGQHTTVGPAAAAAAMLPAVMLAE